jgi:hypothetical protein
VHSHALVVIPVSLMGHTALAMGIALALCGRERDVSVAL